jgi:hypothetical protein
MSWGHGHSENILKQKPMTPCMMMSQKKNMMTMSMNMMMWLQMTMMKMKQMMAPFTLHLFINFIIFYDLQLSFIYF